MRMGGHLKHPHGARRALKVEFGAFPLSSNSINKRSLSGRYGFGPVDFSMARAG
jgi:hypothetical protein